MHYSKAEHNNSVGQLARLVRRVQSHTCNTYCQRKNKRHIKSCRERRKPGGRISSPGGRGGPSHHRPHQIHSGGWHSQKELSWPAEDPPCLSEKSSSAPSKLPTFSTADKTLLQSDDAKIFMYSINPVAMVTRLVLSSAYQFG